ncbi:MAG: LysR family transcriptional regulator [Myxococcota bacterium]
MVTPLPSLASIDLNLLVALDALLQTESVTLAARRLALSQPAVSHALGRLRELLGDELLSREGRSLRRTALAQQLAPAVARVLADIENVVFARRKFDPATTRRTFRIAANDYCGAILLPSVIEQIRREAPGAALEVHAEEGTGPLAELGRGELDLVLGTYPELPPVIRHRSLFFDDFVCVLRRQHPTRGRLSLKHYASLEHLLVASPGYGPGVVDHLLAKHGLQRKVAARVPHFLVAPAVVRRSDLIATLPRRVVEQFGGSGLRIVSPPLHIDAFPVQLIWHGSRSHDAGAAWLRGLIEEVARQR